MYKWEKLNKYNQNEFINLNNQCKKFNDLNKDFFGEYDSSNSIFKFIKKRNIQLLKYDSDYLGYIWSDSYRKEHCLILSLMFTKDIYNKQNQKLIRQLFNEDSIVTYKCNENNFNLKMLYSLEFYKYNGFIEMYLNTNNLKNNSIDHYNNLTFKKFIPQKHEQLRCDLQNKIFYSPNRIALQKEDIEADIRQCYYNDDWSIFLVKKNQYIGYGQIILENNIPTIVNFGLLNAFRGLGYGHKFLNYLINLVDKDKYGKINIRVDQNNKPAIELYKKIGFIHKNTISTLKFR